MSDVAVVRTGVANLASVLAALGRIGAVPYLVDTADDIAAAERVVLPGVGAYAAAMATLRDRELVEPLRAHIEAGRPMLAICLGFQLLAEQSDEGGEVAGLGVIPGRLHRFGSAVRVPQLGWNRVEWHDSADVPGFAYFANSYRLLEAPPGWDAATADHGGSFVAAIVRPGQLGCQFHPELSGEWGEALLRRWWATC